ncbi:50S ribosomal protein L21 [Winogradskyella sp.]|uniref:50S ribosomal protein L21 n=1 Tax=Winogradskyella sp. TaxID=1883156 RepID=UPI00260943CB|nr:50S ribosomal protein L21 [Winogradskyella sp.]
MYAIVEIAGHQFKVEKDQKVFVNRLSTEEGKKVAFDNVLLIGNGNDITLGAPAIDGAQVSAKVLKHLKGDKVIVFKKKRRKGYRVKNGHRQALTEIVIEGITASGAKKVAPKKETKKAEPKAAAPQAEAKKEAPKAKPTANPNSDRATVNFGEDHELNYHLKKNGLSQSIANRKALTELGAEVKEKLGKNILTHEEVDEAIIANIDRFKALKSK